MKKRFLSRLSALVAVILLTMCPLDAYAAVPAVPVASASDVDNALSDDIASDIVLSSQNYDPLAELTEEQYAAYCQTFIDHPRTLCEWPEGLPQPRFVVTLSAAAVYVLYLLAAAVGIVFTWNLASWVQGYDGYDFFSGFEQYMRIMHAGADDFWASWDAVMDATWGKAVTGVQTMYRYLKEYCKARVDGYGTELPSYTVTTDGSFAIIKDGTYFGDKYIMEHKFFGVSAPLYVYCYIYRSSTSVSKSRFFSYIVSSDSFNAFGSNEVVESIGNYYFYNLGSTAALLYSDMCDYVSSQNYCYLGESCGEYMNVKEYIQSSDFVLGVDVAITIAPDKSIVDAQEKTFVSPADTITLPADQAAADALGVTVGAATDAAGVAGALTGTWDLGQTAEDTEDPVLPWVPDITGWLEKLAHGIDALRDDVVAIPGQIADFFTVDTAVVSESASAVQVAFSDRFSGIAQLASVFQRSYQFDTVYPVISVPVPEVLREMFAGKTELVILDLNPFAEHFVYVRGLLIAMLYVAFAFWFLDEFDVKVHIG